MQELPTQEIIYSERFLDALREFLLRWTLDLFEPDSGGFRGGAKLRPTVMSTTDVVWLRYATGCDDAGAPDRDNIVRFLQAQQDPETGMVHHSPDAGLCDGHAFWQTVRALNILNADLKWFPSHIEPMLTPKGLNEWFRSFSWDDASTGRQGHHHEVLGIIPAIVSAGNDALTETLFRNIAAQQSPETGTWPASRANISRTFAYTAIHRAADRLPAHAKRIVDTILEMQNDLGIWDKPIPRFHTMDATYILVRIPPAIEYRQEEAAEALRAVSRALRAVFHTQHDKIMQSTHGMLAIAHTFGLLQEALPGEYKSDRPFRFDWDNLEQYVCKPIIERCGGTVSHGI